MRATPTKENTRRIKVSGLEHIIQSQQPVSLLLGISVGGDAHEGERLSAIVDGINRIHDNDKVIHCDIMLCDTLQRYNYMIDGKTDEEVAIRLSKAEGEAWIKRNKPILEKLKLSYRIIRWDECRSDSQYQTAISEVKDKYNKDPKFQEAISRSTQTFLSRFIKRYKEFQRQHPISENHLENLFEYKQKDFQ